ncbi:MAG: helix-turn-helix transcriptional regulator [Acetobacteraceae bacterium]|nr:helix-turn-helix transcriptional regulator [Acetobacteraceae bacterium]
MMIDCRGDGLGLGKASAADLELGARIRNRREQLGLTQEQVADEIGWFVAQLEDCENGLLRPPSRDLFLLADFLNVEIAYFKEAVGEPVAPVLARGGSAAEEPPGCPGGAAELLSVYARITDPRKQALLLDLAQSFARDSERS